MTLVVADGSVLSSPAREAGRTVFYPKCRATLSVVFDGFGGGDSAPTIIQVEPRSAQVYLNGYKEADTWEMDFDAKRLPISPDLIRSMAVELYLFDSGSTSGDVGDFATVENRLVAGLADNAEMTYGADGRTFRVDGRDYTGLLLDRQWDPKKRVPAGLPLDELVQQLVDEGVGKNKHGGRTLTVVWASDDPKPIVGATAVKTRKNGKPVKDGSNYWDVIYKTVLNQAKIVFVRGLEVVISDPQTMTTQSAGLAAKVAYGRNLSYLKVERKLGKERTPQCRVNGYSDKTRARVTAVFPETKDVVKTGIGTEKDEVRVFTLRGESDPAVLKRYAECMYNNLARGESTVTFSTRSLVDLSEQEVSLLQLRAGHPVSVAFDPFNVEMLESMDQGGQRYSYLLSQGYRPSVAALVAEEYTLVDQFRRPMYTREVRVSWSIEEGVTIDVDAVNFVAPERDDVTAVARRAAGKVAATVSEGVALVSSLLGGGR